MGQPELDGAIRADGAQLRAKQQQGAPKDKRADPGKGLEWHGFGPKAKQ
jgi:hypothetical protein